MNGNDLLVYSQMKQHQVQLLQEARGLHLARAVTRARRVAASMAAPSETQPLAVPPTSVGVLRPARGAKARLSSSGKLHNVHEVAGVPRHEGVASWHKERSSSTPLRRLAARFGSSLVGVGRRLERMDK